MTAYCTAIDTPVWSVSSILTRQEVKITTVRRVDTPYIGKLYAGVGDAMTIEFRQARRGPFTVKLKKLAVADERGLQAAVGPEFQINEYEGSITISLADVKMGNAGTYRIDCRNEAGVIRKAFTLAVYAPFSP